MTHHMITISSMKYLHINNYIDALLEKEGDIIGEFNEKIIYLPKNYREKNTKEECKHALLYQYQTSFYEEIDILHFNTPYNKFDTALLANNEDHLILDDIFFAINKAKIGESKATFSYVHLDNNLPYNKEVVIKKPKTVNNFDISMMALTIYRKLFYSDQKRRKIFC